MTDSTLMPEAESEHDAGAKDWVMVPVPEHLADDVLRHLSRWGVLSTDDAWEEEAIGPLYDRLPETARALLTLAADAAVRRTPLTVAAAAHALGLSALETAGLALEINLISPTVDGPLFAVMVMDDPLIDHPANGWGERLVGVSWPVAQLVRAHMDKR
jgi:hypothetical protein